MSLSKYDGPLGSKRTPPFPPDTAPQPTLPEACRMLLGHIKFIDNQIKGEQQTLETCAAMVADAVAQLRSLDVQREALVRELDAIAPPDYGEPIMAEVPTLAKKRPWHRSPSAPTAPGAATPKWMTDGED